MVHLGNVTHIMAHHALDENQVEAVGKVRDAAKALALVILEVVPTCPDQQVALRRVREAMMNANVAIALRGDG